MPQRSLKIYKPEDLENLLDIDQAKQKTAAECQKLYEDTKQKCMELESQTVFEAKDKFYKEQLELLEKTFKKIDNFFEKSREDLFSVLTLVCQKLKVEQNVFILLTRLLYAEIDKLKIKSNKFTIHGNSVILSHLKSRVEEQYQGIETISFEYELKENLQDDECLLESEYVVVRIRVKDFEENILNLFSSSPLL